MISLVVTSAVLTPFAANAVGGGPYLHNPTDSLVIAETATTLTQALEAGHQYPNVSVASTVGFPDSKGFVVFGFGYGYEVGPVPFLGVSGTGTLLLDPAFTVPVAVPNGAIVNLAARMDDTQVPHGDNDCWLTSSPAGRASCETNIDDISAGGKAVTKTVIYPNPVGLAGADRPTHGVARVNGVVSVFASDDIDNEVATARES
jgi:hypothetical protein